MGEMRCSRRRGKPRHRTSMLTALAQVGLQGVELLSKGAAGGSGPEATRAHREVCPACRGSLAA